MLWFHALFARSLKAKTSSIFLTLKEQPVSRSVNAGSEHLRLCPVRSPCSQTSVTVSALESLWPSLPRRIIRTKVQQPFHPSPDGSSLSTPGHTIGKITSLNLRDVLDLLCAFKAEYYAFTSFQTCLTFIFATQRKIFWRTPLTSIAWDISQNIFF